MPCPVNPVPHYFRMGAIFSKLCFSCCCGGGNKPNHTSNPIQQQSKKQQLSRNTSLIIERSHLFRDVEEVSGYTRVLERDFEIWGKKVVEVQVKKSNSNTSNSSDLNVQGMNSDDKINSFKIDSSNESLELNSNDSDYPKKVNIIFSFKAGYIYNFASLYLHISLISLLGFPSKTQGKQPTLHPHSHQKMPPKFAHFFPSLS